MTFFDEYDCKFKSKNFVSECDNFVNNIGNCTLPKYIITRLRNFTILAKVCYVCNKAIGAFGSKRAYNEYLENRIPLPQGMSELDVTCNSCYDDAYRTYKDAVKEEKVQNTMVVRGLLARTPEYKRKWNKNGIIQFKNERIAILNRTVGAQVEFIIAFDDLTAEGYELKAIDEGKSGNSEGLGGGINSYYYFQKNESLLFPNQRNN